LARTRIPKKTHTNTRTQRERKKVDGERRRRARPYTVDGHVALCFIPLCVRQSVQVIINSFRIQMGAMVRIDVHKYARAYLYARVLVRMRIYFRVFVSAQKQKQTSDGEKTTNAMTLRYLSVRELFVSYGNSRNIV